MSTIWNTVQKNQERFRTEIAVHDAVGCSYSWKRLIARSSEIAQQLIDMSFPANSNIVAVCMPPCADLIVILLSVWYAGKSIVLLDCEQDIERLKSLIDHAGPECLISTIPELVSAENSIHFFSPAEYLSHRPEQIASKRLMQNDFAALLYTSGSTGMPKGVMLPEEYFLSRLDSVQQRFPVIPSDVWLVKSSPGYLDIFWEILEPLVLGCAMYVLGREFARSPYHTARQLQRASITRLMCVPAFLQALLAELPNVGGFPALQTIVCSGAALPAPLAGEVHAALPAVRLINLFGCSEACSIFACEVSPADADIALGTLMPHVLASQLLPVADAAPAEGELLVAGAAVALGYWKDPARTAKRFSVFAGMRAFRTGDIVRHDAAATYWYVGRSDHQVKVRGILVNTDEMEREIRAVQGVRDALCILDADALITFVEATEAVATTRESIRSALQKKYPREAIPSRIEQVRSIPRLINGKPDRSALIAEQTVQSAALPAHPVLQAIAADRELALVQNAVAKLLPQAGIDPEQNFLDYGLHSLQLASLHADLHRAGFSFLSIFDLYEHGSIRSLAAFLRSRNSAVCSRGTA